jgi:hypothetical protein
MLIDGRRVLRLFGKAVRDGAAGGPPVLSKRGLSLSFALFNRLIRTGAAVTGDADPRPLT